MAINNMAAYMAAVWDWSWLQGCFGQTIKVSDVDGMVERRGNFLMLEGKKGGVVSVGQRIMHEQWVKNGGSLIVINGMDHQDTNMIVTASGGPWSAPIVTQGGRDVVRRLCSDWYQWANTNPKGSK